MRAFANALILTGSNMRGFAPHECSCSNGLILANSNTYTYREETNQPKKKECAFVCTSHSLHTIHGPHPGFH